MHALIESDLLLLGDVQHQSCRVHRQLEQRGGLQRGYRLPEFDTRFRGRSRQTPLDFGEARGHVERLTGESVAYRAHGIADHFGIGYVVQPGHHHPAGDGGEVAVGSLVAAGGNAAPLLEALEAASADVAPTVGGLLEAVGLDDRVAG
ncbi:hypothetical protein OHA79_08290 [Streptomyces sp. NBC_00841]|nr:MULTISPECIES: hypothetical protein [unclassified Streptomyces]MCX4536899.1 hypothetical protein [Streptomyces sp. NBC_01669]WRZ97848.1 hypothetical protein OHA79_08290 [Streptomyces sp. NBC_00841]